MLPHIYFLHVIREYLHRPPKEEIRTTLIPTVVKMCKIILFQTGKSDVLRPNIIFVISTYLQAGIIHCILESITYYHGS